MRSNILNFHSELKNKTINENSLILESINNFENCKDTNSTITYLKSENVKFDEEKILSCIPYSLKDLYCTKDIKTTAGSKFYKDYIPPYSSFVYETLNSCGGILVSKDACDEFGMGGSGLECFNGYVSLYCDKNRTPMGSSSGSVNNVASGVSVFAIGTDTVDSTRRPATLSGVVGYKPTYGLISRYGIFAYASSMDTVGIITKYVTDCAIVATELIKKDKKDFSNVELKEKIRLPQKLSSIKVSLLEGIEEYLSDNVKKIYLDFIELLKKNNYEIQYKKINKKIFDILTPVFICKCYGEATTNRALDTGLQVKNNASLNKNYNDTLVSSRSDGFGVNIKRRLLLGSFFTSRENYESIFLKSEKIIHEIKQYVNELLSEVDCLILPGSSDFAPLINEVLEKKNMFTYADESSKLANFSGIPSISIPLKTTTLP
jgi:aspartyl-tRNA(Asn)/glutamyl-tRNA(Gln) amidotransferase subunit A